MTQEEKARAYDEALERARKQRDDYQKELNKADKNSQLAGLLRAGISAIELAFSELHESEDERIRKAILNGIQECQDAGSIFGTIITRAGITYLDVYAWLEKQKEYELTEEDKKIIPEALVMLCDDIINHRVHTPIKTDEEGARKIKAFLKTFNRQPHKTMKEWERQKEQKPVEKQDYSGLNDLEKAIHRGFLAFIDSLPDETCKDSLQVHETCKENTDSFTCLKDDLALTWEDMAKIDAIIIDVNN